MYVNDNFGVCYKMCFFCWEKSILFPVSFMWCLFCYLVIFYVGYLFLILSFFTGRRLLAVTSSCFFLLEFLDPLWISGFFLPFSWPKKKKFLFCFCSECGFSFSSLLTSYVSASCQLLSIPFSCCWIFNPNSTNIFPRKEELQKVKWMEENEAVLYNIKPGSGMASHVFTLSISPLNNMSLS